MGGHFFYAYTEAFMDAQLTPTLTYHKEEREKVNAYPKEREVEREVMILMLL